MTHANSSSSFISRRGLDGGARVAALPSRSAARGLVHVVNSECSHELAMGGARGVKGLEEVWKGMRLLISRIRRRSRAVCGSRVRATNPPHSVYFPSFGGEALPNLIIVLQGDGVMVDLIGDTFINKAGVTTSTFTSIPDAPDSNSELYLPKGSGSALATDGSLREAKEKSALTPTLIAQDGMRAERRIKIAVSGRGKRKRHRRSARRGGVRR